MKESPSGPRTVPLKTLQELLEWQSSTVDEELVGADLDDFRDAKAAGRRLLVCHDMAGGYLDDSYARGYQVELDGPPPFYIIHWQYMHTFVYFSHHLVTIPPVAWISAAHTNGVLVLGTFITEFDEGSKICKELFVDEANWRKAAKNLALIAKTYNFDGYLLNIENPIARDDLPDLLSFIELVRDECRQKIGPHSQVIWYDSVITSSGRLKWQDELNALNSPCFDAADGLFLNYGWSESALASSKELAGDRASQVYVGVDCFGRGCFGDGGFNCDAALQLINKHRPLSVALFAPGWVYEKAAALGRSQLLHNWHKFWTLIANETGCYPVRQLPIPFTTHMFNGCSIPWEEEGVVHVGIRKQQIQAHLCCSPTPAVYNRVQSDWRTGYTHVTHPADTACCDYTLMCFELPVTKPTGVLVHVRAASEVVSSRPATECSVALVLCVSESADPIVGAAQPLPHAGGLDLNAQLQPPTTLTRVGIRVLATGGEPGAELSIEIWRLSVGEPDGTWHTF